MFRLASELVGDLLAPPEAQQRPPSCDECGCDLIAHVHTGCPCGECDLRPSGWAEWSTDPKQWLDHNPWETG